MNTHHKNVLVDEISDLTNFINELSISDEDKEKNKSTCDSCIRNLTSSETDLDMLVENFTKLTVDISKMDKINDEPDIATDKKSNICDKIIKSLVMINSILLEVKAKRYEYNLFVKDNIYFIESF